MENFSKIHAINIEIVSLKSCKASDRIATLFVKIPPLITIILNIIFKTNAMERFSLASLCTLCFLKFFLIKVSSFYQDLEIKFYHNNFRKNKKITIIL